MRVALSMLTLVPGISGGSETYARGLARGLATAGSLDATALVPTLAPDAGEGLPTRVVDAYPASTTTAGRLCAMTRAALVPGAMREALEGFDVVHYPLTVPLPHTPSGRVAITLHDLQHRDLPHLFSRGERLFRRLAYDRAARSADAVIVPSGFVRDRARALGMPTARMEVIPLGVDLERFTPGHGGAAREPFLLYPARPWAHKNHPALIEAFAMLRRRRPGLTLVLTGAGTEALARGIDGVDARGAVPLDELVALYRQAACCVFPSLYEGFGVPPLEAMACGTPVAASTAGSLPEVCGDAAVLFDPSRPEAIAAGIEEALEGAGDLRERGLARASSFTWAAAAARHASLYATLAAQELVPE